MQLHDKFIAKFNEYALLERLIPPPDVQVVPGYAVFKAQVERSLVEKDLVDAQLGFEIAEKTDQRLTDGTGTDDEN